MKTSLAAAGFAIALLVASGSGLGHNYEKGDLSIRHPWTRATTPEEKMVPAYLEIRNSGVRPDRLVGASSPAAEQVDVVLVRDKMLVRERVDVGLEVPARERLVLRPHTSHLLLVNLARPLSKGERVPVTLRFERVGELHVELEVQGLDSRKPHH